MRLLVYQIAFLACVYGRTLQEEAGEQQLLPALDSSVSLPEDSDTVFALGGSQTGAFQVTGMLHNFVLDQDPVNTFLDRPSTTYLDVSWSNWVDQRLELLDLFQDLLTPPSRPRCAHMHSSSAMDNGMVSYLASSRFGPAILTTYAHQAGEEQVDFDYDSVNIPAGRPLQRSYEDASLQEEMSADADKAFEMAAIESRMLSQEPNLGYFGANMKNQMLYGQLDGDSESLQPVILAHPNLLDLVEKRENLLEALASKQDFGSNPPQGKVSDAFIGPIDPKQLTIFVLLLIGCLYVWISLAVSCTQLRRQASSAGRVSGTDAAYLLVPLAPERVESLQKVQVAAEFQPNGDFMKPLAA